MRRVVWCLKQLLPLKYCSAIRRPSGKVEHIKWRMWFGRCFNVTSTHV